MADLQGHHDLFQRRVPRTFTQTIDGALDLSRATFNSRQRIGRSHPQIIMTMGRKDNLVGPRHRVDQPPDQIGTLDRGGVAYGIGNVDRRRTGLDGNLDHAA